jgi:hypothetical protein
MQDDLMLETCVNQGAGLQSIALQASPRVIAMASHGDQQGEMPLLWGLCSTLVDSGYSVMVLDANAVESDNNPGLAQLLDDASWRDGELDEELIEPKSWSVLPAALGLLRMSRSTEAQGLPLDPLGGLLQNFGVIVIYARADVLVRLLPGSGIQPLLTVSALKTSPVTAYQALKQMLLNANLHPTVARIVVNDGPDLSEMGRPEVDNLKHCAMEFLGYQIDPLTIRARQPKNRDFNDVSRLALRLLENAMPLHRHHFVESH